MDYKNLAINDANTYFIDKERLIRVYDDGGISDINDGIVRVRTDDEFKDKAIFLDDKYDWVLGRDSGGLLVLIPLRK